MRKTVAILGSGPAALRAAEVVSHHGHRVLVFEKRKGLGRKLLIAGSSGLNISNSLPLEIFSSHYHPASAWNWKGTLQGFSPQDWLTFIENELGLETFEGTSGRYFVREMKASKLLKIWVERLRSRGVEFFLDHECVAFHRNSDSSGVIVEFQQGQSVIADAVCFALGGGSYEPSEKPLRWPEIFKSLGIAFTPFAPSNVGYQVQWSSEFLKECEGLPIKNASLFSSRGQRKGDLVITNYGIEGTPVYFVGESARVHLDLKPDLSVEQMQKKCMAVKENLSPMRRVKKQLGLCPASLGLLFHHTPAEIKADLKRLLSWIKAFPLELGESQSLEESISSSGGIEFSELDSQLMLKKVSGVFLAGEMLNWDAPTGGFLIQGCVSQGHQAGVAILKYLDQL